jgi:transaldolase
MKLTTPLYHLGQSIWLDKIARDLLDSGTLKQYIDELSVMGLTSNPTIFKQAIKNSSTYDADIRDKLKEEIDDGLNRLHTAGLEGSSSKEGSRLTVYVIPTDEEVLIARDTMRCISQGQHHSQEREYVNAL